MLPAGDDTQTVSGFLPESSKAGLREELEARAGWHDPNPREQSANGPPLLRSMLRLASLPAI